MKKIISMILIIILCFSQSMAAGERKSVVRDHFYLGAMRVVNCKEFVSLREIPDKTGPVLAKVPLDAIVYYCSNNVNQYAAGTYKKQASLFIRCEYEGQEGYILKKHLKPAPEYEPAETRQNNDEMTRKEIIGSGEVILEWKEFNVSVLASYEEIKENNETWECIHIGCFINDIPNWGYTEAVKVSGQPVTLKAFMGGTEDEPMVYVYDEAYGLSMLDLMDGTEVWTIMKGECTFGDAAVYTVGENTGILYITGSVGPAPIAVSSEGNILWQSEINDPSVIGPTEIKLNVNDIEVVYESGKIVTLEYNGELISIRDI